MRKLWTMVQENWIVGVESLPSGRFLGFMKMRPVLDPAGANTKSESFETVEEALAYIGYPHEIVGIPVELR